MDLESVIFAFSTQFSITWAVIDDKLLVITSVVIKGLLPIVDKVLLILDIGCEMLTLTVVGEALVSYIAVGVPLVAPIIESGLVLSFWQVCVDCEQHGQ